MKILQKGFNYSQDGPGNRLVYHLQGCNFRCKWCSNPESMRCDYTGAKEYSVQDIADEIIRSRMMFFDGGGVTFTGGEPTLQVNEIKTVIEKIKPYDIHIAIETNGSSSELPSFSEYIDYLIMDIKQPDDEIHKKFVAHSNAQTIKNLKILSEKRKQLHLRIPLINGVNTDPKPFTDLFSEVNMSNTVVEILPYHEYGKCKWVEEYEITDGFVSDEKLLNFEFALKNAGIKIIKT